MPLNFSIGSFHDTLPEDQAREEGFVIQRADVPGVAAEFGWTEQALLDSITADATAYKVRDTLYTSFFAENFTDEKRAGKKLPPVNLDSLTFSPTRGAFPHRHHLRGAEWLDGQRHQGAGPDTVRQAQRQEGHAPVRLARRSPHGWKLAPVRASPMLC